MSQKKIFNYFLITILISSSIYFLWLVKLLNDFPWRYVFTDWIINYKGGYIRRGLLGEISINLAGFFDSNIKYIFFLIHLLIYLTFHLIFYKFFTHFKKNYIFYFFCFSPLVFLYPIATFEAFARKEIFYITFFLINCYFLVRTNNRNLVFISTNFFILLSYFIHESSLFFIGFFYFSYFIFLKKNNYKRKFSEFFLIFIIFLILIYFTFIPVTDEKISDMVFFVTQNFYKVTEFAGAISFLNNDLSDRILFWKDNSVSAEHIFRHILYLHFLIIFLYLLNINNFFKSSKYYLIFTLLTFFTPIVLFLIANDWGRFVYILYNFCLIFTFYCLYDDENIFIKINELTFVKNLNYRLKLFLTVSYISLWTPKLLYFEKVELFALINVIFELIKYSIKYTNLIL